jgi:hypothetical protein
MAILIAAVLFYSQDGRGVKKSGKRFIYIIEKKWKWNFQLIQELEIQDILFGGIFKY